MSQTFPLEKKQESEVKLHN